MLFTFPSRYLFAIGLRRVFSLGGWSPQLPAGFLVPRGTQETSRGRGLVFRLQGFHLLWRVFPDTSTTRTLCNSPALVSAQDQSRSYDPRGTTRARFNMPPSLGYSHFARRYSGNLYRFLFPPGTEIFQFPGFAAPPYEFRRSSPDMTRAGLPHSEIAGSKVVCTSPTLIAVYHVLHRLPEPRHPPYALCSLTQISLAQDLFSSPDVPGDGSHPRCLVPKFVFPMQLSKNVCAILQGL